jgi:tetratricopeptide (TPR) repeat protein
VPLSGLSICAVGDRVVVRDGIAHWQADDGQYLLGLDVGVQDGELRVVERMPEPAASAPVSPKASRADTIVAGEDPFERALAIEETNPRAAIELYKQATEEDACNIAAWINWGRLHQELDELQQAEAVYRRAYDECGPDALLMFNLGVLLEDTGRAASAVDAYQEAVQHDPALADGHFNLARLYEAMGKQQHAIRHFGQYRRLVLTDRH